MVFEQIGIIAGSAREYDYLLPRTGNLRPFCFYVLDEASIFGQKNTLFAFYGTFYTRPLYFFRNLESICRNPLKQNATVYLDWIDQYEAFKTEFDRPEKSWKKRALARPVFD